MKWRIKDYTNADGSTTASQGEIYYVLYGLSPDGGEFNFTYHAGAWPKDLASPIGLYKVKN
jgi:hypothetical protein